MNSEQQESDCHTRAGDTGHGTASSSGTGHGNGRDVRQEAGMISSLPSLRRSFIVRVDRN